MKVVAQEGQSMMDIAIQYLGSMEEVFQACRMNGVSITDRLQAGQEVELPPIRSKNAKTVEYYRVNGVSPATDVDDNEDESLDVTILTNDGSVLTSNNSNEIIINNE